MTRVSSRMHFYNCIWTTDRDKAVSSALWLAGTKPGLMPFSCVVSQRGAYLKKSNLSLCLPKLEMSCMDEL